MNSARLRSIFVYVLIVVAIIVLLFQFRSQASATQPMTLTELASAIAMEWEAQAQDINPHSMPLTKLANTAIDRAGPHLQDIRNDILAYAANDQVC